MKAKLLLSSIAYMTQVEFLRYLREKCILYGKQFDIVVDESIFHFIEITQYTYISR